MNRKALSARAGILSWLGASVCFAQAVPDASKETSAVEVEQCVAQHDRARQLHLAENWQAARAAMSDCAEARCPLAIAADCRAWLDEVAHVLPTLLVIVERDAVSARQAPLRVELDGAPLVLPDPPRPLELLPGSHSLRFELAGYPRVERRFTLEKGEKNHVEQVRFAPPAARVRSTPVPRPTTRSRPIPNATYWLSGSALVAFAGSAALLVSGVRAHADAQARCSPTCESDVRRSIETRLVLADISAGAGLALAGLAAYTYATRPVVVSESQALGPVLVTSARGVTLFWRGQFQ